MGSIQPQGASSARRYRIRYRLSIAKPTERLSHEERDQRLQVADSGMRTILNRPGSAGLLSVAPTGVDPVTFRFSVERSTN